MARSRAASIAVVLACVLAGGCSVITDNDDFTNRQNLNVTLSRLGIEPTAQATTVIEIEVADTDANELAARAMFYGLAAYPAGEGMGDDAAGMDLHLPGALGRADEYALIGRIDTAGDGFDATADPSFVATASDESVVAVTDPRVMDVETFVTPPPGTFTLTLVNFHLPHTGEMIEVWVREAATRGTVGYARVASHPGTMEHAIVIPNVLEPDTEYEVEFYADESRNRRYDGQPLDHSYRLFLTSGGDGNISETFTHHTDFVDIGPF